MTNMSTDGQENATFEAKKRQPKFNFRTLNIIFIFRLQDAPRKLSDVARNGDEFKAVVYLANSLVRALVTNAKAEVREKLLSQFEAWFRFLLDAQEGHSGEQGGDSIMIHEVTTRTTLIRAREEEAKNIVLRVAIQ